VIGMEDRPGQAAAGALGIGQGLEDQLGAHMVRDREPHRAP